MTRDTPRPSSPVHPGPTTRHTTRSAGGEPPAPRGEGRATEPVRRLGPPPMFAQAMTPTGTVQGVGTQARVQKSHKHRSRPALGPDARPVPRPTGVLGRCHKHGKAHSQGLQAWFKTIYLPLPQERTVPHPGDYLKSTPPPVGSRHNTDKQALSLQGSAASAHKGSSTLLMSAMAPPYIDASEQLHMHGRYGRCC